MLYSWQSEDRVAKGGFHLSNFDNTTGIVSNYRIISSSHRNKGYGTDMMRALIVEAIRRDMFSIVLVVLRDNHIAIRVYEKSGFVKDDSFKSNHSQYNYVWWMKLIIRKPCHRRLVTLVSSPLLLKEI